MKKTIIAALIACGATVAQAQVTVSGKVSEWYDSSRIGSTRVNGLQHEATSNLRVGAEEKLGNGLTARAAVETSLFNNSVDGTNNTQLGDRQRTVGVAHAMGSVDIGRNIHSTFLAISDNDSFSTLYGSVAGDVHNLRGLRLNNATFVTLTPMKGVTASWDRGADAMAADATSYAVSASLGPVNGVVSQYSLGREKSTVVGANARFGDTTVFYSHSDNDGVVKNKGDLVGARHQLGAYAVKGSYGKTNDNVKAYAVGVDYALSKRTEVGVAYRNIDRVATAADVKGIAVGLTHRF